MESFWESSWSQVDLDRVQEYVRKSSIQEDPLLKLLHRHQVRTVCDAGCGCGIGTARLAAEGFQVSAFDVSAHAVALAQALLRKTQQSAELRTASILKTGYQDAQFDCVVSKDVLDHMHRAEAAQAVQELLRITRPGGLVLFTLDDLDEEYCSEPHLVNSDGDYMYTGGKWEGMVFHPYSAKSAYVLIPDGIPVEVLESSEHLTILLRKNGPTL